MTDYAPATEGVTTPPRGDRSPELTQPRPPVRKINFHGGSADVRRARKVHYCTVHDDYPYPCVRQIPAGQEYVRVVLFPNHDVATRDFPVVYDVCYSCAPNDLHLGRLRVEIPVRSSPGSSTSTERLGSGA